MPSDRAKSNKKNYPRPGDPVQSFKEKAPVRVFKAHPLLNFLDFLRLPANFGYFLLFVKAPPLFITGTGTGTGKTTLTALLTIHLRRRGIHAVAVKPYCSGTREDTELLALVNDHELTSEQITPVFCPKPLAPRAGLSADASRSGFRKAIKAIEETSKNVERLLIEGIGGLEVPLAPGISVSDLIAMTKSNAIITGRNRLGVINEVSLTQYRLREKTGKIGQIVLMQERKLDESASSNARILAEKFKIPRIIMIPYLGSERSQMSHLKHSEKKVKKMLAWILKSANVSSGFFDEEEKTSEKKH